MNDSNLCSKFSYDSRVSAKTVTFSVVPYAGITDKKDYEGMYLITGQPIHASNVPFSTSLSFKVDMRLNCDEVIIQ